MSRHELWHRLLLIIAGSGALALFLSAAIDSAWGTGMARAATTTTVIPYQSTGWKYDEVATGTGDGFQAPSFDDSAWATGQAGFGSTGGTCSWNTSADVNTNWDPNTDMLVRKHFTVPSGATVLHLDGTIDNNATVYVNGAVVQTIDSGNCTAGAINVDIPGSLLTADNVIAIRGTDTGTEDYLDVQLTAIQENAMGTGPQAVIVPSVASINSQAKIRLDLTKDGKDPFCGQYGAGCSAGWASTVSWAYFPKSTSFALKLKNRSTGEHCDSTQPNAANVAPIEPPGSDSIGYQVSFDPDCGTTGSPNYSGVVADLYVMDSAPVHDYYAAPGGGFQGTDHLVKTLQTMAALNGVTCITGKALKAVNDLLSISDYAELIAEINSAKFAETLVKIKAEDFQDLLTKPLAGTRSCEAMRMFAQAAVMIHAEAIAARNSGSSLDLSDHISLNGKYSNYELFVADPAGISSSGTSTLPIVNVNTNEQDSMLTRALLAGLPRTSSAS